MTAVHEQRAVSNEQTDAQYRQMTQRPIRPLIIGLCIPAIISNLVTMGYNLADTYFIGRLGTSQSGAIGIAFSVMAIMQAIGFFFGNGAGNSLSRELGKHNELRAARLMTVGLCCSVGCGLLITAITLPTLHVLVYGLGATTTIAPYAVSYLTPLLVVAPLVCGSFTMNGLLRYQGLSAYSMIGLVTGVILNAALAPILIFVVGLGIFGAGLATAICQTCSFLILFTICVRTSAVRVSWRHCTPDVLLIREIIGGGLPSLLRQSVGSVAVTAVNLAANPFGDAAIAAMAIVMRLMQFTNSIIVGLGQGFQPVCGYNYGAGLIARVTQGYWFCVRVSTTILVALASTIAWLAPELIELFRSDPQVIAIGVTALRLQCCTVVMLGVNMMSNMMQQTIGMTAVASFLGVCRQGLYLVPLVLLLPHAIGLLGVQIAQPISDVLTFATTLPLQRTVLRTITRSRTNTR